MSVGERDFEALRAQGDHLVVTEVDEGWDLARQAFNLTLDQRPVCVARPASVEDIVATVNFAREAGLRVAPQLSGHNAGPLESMENTILLKTDAFTQVTVDPEGRSARVEAGVKWADVIDAADPHGLSALSGSSRDVGVVGYHLGGGLSFLSRKHGLANNSVTAIELVTAAGEVLRVSADNEPDLFWALRGGGGNFGIVTALEFDLFETPEIYAGTLFFPIERAAEVLHAWREWTTEVPDELTSVGRLLRVPPLPDVPEPLRGREFVTVGVVYLGEEQAGAALLEPIRALGPEIDTVAMVPPAALGTFAMDPEDPMPYAATHTIAERLTEDVIDQLVEAAGEGSGSMLVVVEMRHIGGAIAESAPGGGALDRLPGEFMVFSVAALMAPEMAAPVAAQLAELRRIFEPHQAGLYANFVEERVELSDLHSDQTCARLREVRQAWDPDGMFLASHQV